MPVGGGLTVAELVAKLRLDSSEFDRGMAASARNMQMAGKTMSASSKAMSGVASSMDGVSRSQTGLTKATVAGTAAQTKMGTAVQGTGRHLSSYSSNVQQAEKSTGRFSNFLAGNATMAMSSFVKGIGAMAGAMILWESVSYTGRVEEMNIALERVGKNVGWTTDQIQEQISAIKEMGITTDVAQYTLSQFARANLDVAKASQLARVAQDAAIFAQRDSSETLRWLIYGVQTYQTEIFRTQGLNVNVGKSFENYAKSVNKSAEALTESERQQAVLNEVLKTGATIAGAYEAAMESGSKQMRSMPRYFSEIKEAIGGVLLPAFTAAVFAVKDLIAWFRDAVEEGGFLSGIFRTVGTVVSGAFKGLGAILKSVTGFFSENEAAAKALATVLTVVLAGAAVKAAVAGWTSLVAAGGKLLASFAMTTAAATAWHAPMVALTGQTALAAMATTGFAGTLKALATSFITAATAAAPLIALTAVVGAFAYAWQQSQQAEEKAQKAAEDWVAVRQRLAGISDESPIGQQLGFSEREISRLEQQIARVEDAMGDPGPAPSLMQRGQAWLGEFLFGADVPVDPLDAQREQLDALKAIQDDLEATMADTTSFVVEQASIMADLPLPSFAGDFEDDFLSLLSQGEDGIAKMQDGFRSLAELDMADASNLSEIDALATAYGVDLPDAYLEALSGAQEFDRGMEYIAANVQRKFVQGALDAATAANEAGIELTRVADTLGIDIASMTTVEAETLQRFTQSADDATGVSVALAEAFTTLDGETSSLAERIGALGAVTDALLTKWYGVDNARQAFREALDGFVEDYRSAEEEMTGSGSQLVQSLITQFAGVGQALANEGTNVRDGLRDMRNYRQQLLDVAEAAGITGPELETLADHLDSITGVHVASMQFDGLADVQAAASLLRQDIDSLTDDPEVLASVVQSLVDGIAALEDMPIRQRDLIEEWFGPMGAGHRQLGRGLLVELLGDDREALNTVRGFAEEAGLLFGNTIDLSGGLNQPIRDNILMAQEEIDRFESTFPRQISFYTEIFGSEGEALADMAVNAVDEFVDAYNASIDQRIANLPNTPQGRAASRALAAVDEFTSTWNQYVVDHPVQFPPTERTGAVAAAQEAIEEFTRAWNRYMERHPQQFPATNALDGLNIQGFTGAVSRPAQQAPDPTANVPRSVEVEMEVVGSIFRELQSITSKLTALAAKNWVLRAAFDPRIWGELARLAKEAQAIVDRRYALKFTIDSGIFGQLQNVESLVDELMRDRTANYSLNFTAGGDGYGMVQAARNLAHPIDGTIDEIMAYGQVSGVPMEAVSTYRPGAVTSTGNASYHSMGRAVDFAGPDLMGIFNAFARVGPWLRELIYTPAGGRQIKDGEPHVFTGGTIQADHYDHVHVAAKHGGYFAGATRALIGEAGPEVVLPLSRHQDMVDVIKRSGSATQIADALHEVGRGYVGFATGGGAGLGTRTQTRAAARRSNTIPQDLRNWLALIHRALLNPNRNPQTNRRLSDADQAWQTRKEQIREARRQAYMLQQAMSYMVGMLGPSAGYDIKRLVKAGISISEIRSMVQAMKEWRKSYKAALVDMTVGVGKSAAAQAASWGLPLEKIQEYSQMAVQFAESVRGAAQSATDVTGYKNMRMLGSGRSYRRTAEWASGVRELQSRGLDAKLIRQLAEAGPEAYREVRRILNGGAALIGQLNAQARLVNDTVDSLIETLVTKNAGPDSPDNVVTAGMTWGQKWAEDFAEGLMNSPAIAAAAQAYWNQLVADVMDNAGIDPGGEAPIVRPLRTMSSHQFLQAYVNKLNNNQGPYTRAQLNEELRRRMTTATQEDLNINDPILQGDALAAVRRQFTYWLEHRATGGSLLAGQAAVVGEYGPELFVPASNGYVIPNGQAMRNLLQDPAGNGGGSAAEIVRSALGEAHRAGLIDKNRDITNHFHVAGFIDRDTVVEIAEAQEWANRKAAL